MERREFIASTILGSAAAAGLVVLVPPQPTIENYVYRKFAGVWTKRYGITQLPNELILLVQVRDGKIFHMAYALSPPHVAGEEIKAEASASLLEDLSYDSNRYLTVVYARMPNLGGVPVHYFDYCTEFPRDCCDNPAHAMSSMIEQWKKLWGDPEDFEVTSRINDVASHLAARNVL